MRIGVFDPYLDTLSGGEKYMLTLASCLSAKHDVRVFWDPASESLIREKAKQKLGIDISPVRFERNIFDRQVSFATRLFLSKKYDCIVVLSDGSIPFVLSRLFVHFQFPVEWVSNQSLKTKLKLSRVEKVICNSLFTKTYIDRKFGLTGMVLYPPVEIANTYNEKKEPIILNVGRFGVYGKGSSYKKQDIMIETFRKMVDKGLCNWRLVLVVSLSEEEKQEFIELKRKAEKYPIDFIENPDSKKLWLAYSKASIYWHAAGFGEDFKKHPERLEHFGITTVEAMGMGAVPVVINKGGQVEIVEEGKNGFLWDTLDELAVKTERLIKDKQLWSVLSGQAKKKAHTFSKDRFCEDAQNLFLR